MKRNRIALHVIFCFTFALCGILQMGGMVHATTVVSAQPDTTETQSSGDEADTQNGWNDKKTSYFVNGQKVTGIQKIEGKLFYFDEEGNLYKKFGKKKINGKTYYFDSTDYSLKTGAVKIGKRHYYFKKDNGEQYDGKGIEKVDGQYYNFSSKHYLQSGWYRDKKKTRYYFDKKTFAALTGWNYVGKYKYYFNDKGQLQQDVRELLTKKQKSSYSIRVNRTACCVTVYAKDGKKGYTIPVVAFVCSPGKGTPVGTFKLRDKLRWHELMGPCWGQWCEHLTDNILFHSVIYTQKNNNRSLNVAEYNKLGTMASHGCIRLLVGDAKWIFDNCKVGTQVVIYNDKKNPGPFDKPKAQKLKGSHTWDPTDPKIKK